MPTYRIPRLSNQREPRPDAAGPYVEKAQRQLRENGGSPDALFTLAAWKAVRGEYDHALAILHRLTKRDPDYPGVWRFKAEVYRRLGKDKMAQLCEETARRHPMPTARPSPR